MDKPTIVCLCGSTRFYEAFQQANFQETMAGRIVLSVGFYPHASEQMHGEHIGISEDDKARLDELHLRKIDLADEVLILNVGGYIGNSTSRELAYAVAAGKRVRYLEDPFSETSMIVYPATLDKPQDEHFCPWSSDGLCNLASTTEERRAGWCNYHELDWCYLRSK